MAKNAIGLAIATEEYGSKFFANGAAPGGVLEHPGTIKDPQKVRDAWQTQFGGSHNANKIAVLEEGMKYTPIGISPEQAQFLVKEPSASRMLMTKENIRFAITGVYVRKSKPGAPG